MVPRRESGKPRRAPAIPDLCEAAAAHRDLPAILQEHHPLAADRLDLSDEPVGEPLPATDLQALVRQQPKDFGVTASDAASSGLRATTLGGGYRSAGIQLALVWRF